MATRSSGRRYAEAAFELALRDGDVDRWLLELELAAARLAEPDAQRALVNPAVPAATRIELAERILGDRVGDRPLNLVRLLLRRGRIDLLPQVAHEFRRLYERREGIVRAEITSASPLGEADLLAIRERLAGMSGGRIEASVRVDPQLLGGITVRLGDRFIDGSVRGRLERLRDRLAAGAV
jgi:F-type H+-transporting ATPase subunit delta